MYRIGNDAQESRLILGSAVAQEFSDYRKQSTDPYKPVAFSQKKTAGASFTRSTPTIQDPRTSYLSLMVPEDHRILNQLYRYYDSTDPIIQNAHRLHTEFPLSGMSLIDCGDPAIQAHFEEMWNDRIQGDTFLLDCGIEYNRMGNVVTFGAWNESDMMWDKIAILNTDYVIIEDTWLAQRPLIKLRPDDNLKTIVTTMRPKALYEQLHPEIIKYVRMGRDIPLHPANTWHIAYNRAPYEVWGSPPIKALLKLLFFENKLMEAQTAVAYRHIVPITLVKVGHEASGWLPEQSELDAVEEILAARELDPNMAVIYHYGINIDYVGASGKVLPIQQDLTRIDELKMMGLGISKAFLGGEGGPTYSNASVALAVLKQRYIHMTRKFSRFIHHGLFQPVADACGFYRVKRAKAGYGKVSHYSYGDIAKEASAYAKGFKPDTIRDIQDNQEFKDLCVRKAMEQMQKTAAEARDYMYPKADWNLTTLAGDLDWRRWVSEYNDKFQQNNNVPFVSDATMYKLMGLDERGERRTILRELLENKERKEVLQRNQIIPGGQNTGGAANGELGGLMGGGGGMPGPGMPPDLGGGEMGGPDMEAPLGEPGMEGEALPTGGALGEMPSPNDIPTASQHRQRTVTSDMDDALIAAEKDILRNLEKELKRG